MVMHSIYYQSPCSLYNSCLTWSETKNTVLARRRSCEITNNNFYIQKTFDTYAQSESENEKLKNNVLTNACMLLSFEQMNTCDFVVI